MYILPLNFALYRTVPLTERSKTLLKRQRSKPEENTKSRRGSRSSKYAELFFCRGGFRNLQRRTSHVHSRCFAN